MPLYADLLRIQAIEMNDQIRKEYYLKSNNNLYSYNQLFKDTISDIDKKSNQVRGITLL